MPPRKKSTNAQKSTTNSASTAVKRTDNVVGNVVRKKVKKEETLDVKLDRIIKEENTKQKVKSQKPDQILVNVFSSQKVSVHEDYSCMLNQTNIGQNNNKFYVIQVAKQSDQFMLFTKWGRVGESGQHNISYFTSADDVIKDFKKKFKDKTKNDWDKRENFTPVPGKYTMIEMSDDDSDDEVDNTPKAGKSEALKEECSDGCCLDDRTQLMIQIIFNTGMFEDQMEVMNLDIRKMPLGKLSKTQIMKGLQILLEIEEEIKKGSVNSSALETLCSKFYTLIPHNFGRNKPPVMSTLSITEKKKEMIMTLLDIEIAQSLQKEKVTTDKEVLHPLDVKYNQLCCKLERINDNSDEFQLFRKYATSNRNYRVGKLLDVWKVDRSAEGERFRAHNSIEFRKLLWHGTNVAVVAAILKAGLRIMPHSGGLVGKGIYFASEYDKSSGYVSAHHGMFNNEKNVGFMFLSEVALGRMKFIKHASSHLTEAPKGFDSVVARGSSEPDPKKDVKMKFDGKEVIIPVGKSVIQKDFQDSGFHQSEYLVYKESQVRIRYLLKFSFA